MAYNTQPPAPGEPDFFYAPATGDGNIPRYEQLIPRPPHFADNQESQTKAKRYGVIGVILSFIFFPVGLGFSIAAYRKDHKLGVSHTSTVVGLVLNLLATILTVLAGVSLVWTANLLAAQGEDWRDFVEFVRHPGSWNAELPTGLEPEDVPTSLFPPTVEHRYREPQHPWASGDDDVVYEGEPHLYGDVSHFSNETKGISVSYVAGKLSFNAGCNQITAVVTDDSRVGPEVLQTEMFCIDRAEAEADLTEFLGLAPLVVFGDETLELVADDETLVFTEIKRDDLKNRVGLEIDGEARTRLQGAPRTRLHATR